MKRIFLIVLDSFGIGSLPDADAYGDTGSNTLKTCYETGLLRIPNLHRLGLGNIDGVSCLRPKAHPAAAYARLAECSKGKDTTTGHWEIAGLISGQAFPTYPNGFPEDVIRAFAEKTGRGVLCNRPYSGTEVIREYGAEHLKTGALIVYTSADSVFQIAAHEECVPPEQLYDYCRTARALLTGKHAVGRVIARPFIGSAPDFTRTERRRDFSLEPTGPTLLDRLKAASKDVFAVGKISDIFAGRGITQAIPSHNNKEGTAATLRLAQQDFNGLCFTNLVDFDTLYGHRNDAAGYARALNAFDRWLGTFLPLLREDDLCLITADHGCDPGFPGTDHTREYTPLLIYGKKQQPGSLGTHPSFSYIAKQIAAELEVPYENV